MANRSTQRPKGFAPWSPAPHVQVLLEQVKAILVEYRDELPLTNRQIFYRLVGTVGYEKTEQAYKRLCGYLTRARRAGILKFGNIRDDKVNSMLAGGWLGLEDFQQAIRESANSYNRDYQDGQSQHVELWCEAEGMIPQLYRVASDYSVSVYSASGFLSVTAMYDIARRVKGRADEGIPTLLLHVGDYDPSGESIYETIRDDAGAFVAQAIGSEYFDTRRVALTEEQIDEYQLESAPPKAGWTGRKGDKGDSRTARWHDAGRFETTQAEALSPRDLARIVRDAIEAEFDIDQLNQVRAAEAEERVRLQEWLEDLT